METSRAFHLKRSRVNKWIILKRIITTTTTTTTDIWYSKQAVPSTWREAEWIHQRWTRRRPSGTRLSSRQLTLLLLQPIFDETLSDTFCHFRASPPTPSPGNCRLGYVRIPRQAASGELARQSRQAGHRGIGRLTSALATAPPTMRPPRPPPILSKISLNVHWENIAQQSCLYAQMFYFNMKENRYKTYE